VKKILIDVSEHQGVIDWEKAMYHIDGAILRCGYGGDYEDQDDEQFRRNADECTRLGIPFGVYIYSYAKSIQAAQYEADHVLRLIKPYKLSYPVYLDLEESGTEKGAVERAEVFGDIIENAGYWCGIYANLYWWEMILKNNLERFTKWVAQYYSKCEYTGSNLDIWQYTSKGNVPGINGSVDMNECYRDFPLETAGKGTLRPVYIPAPKPIFKSIDDLVEEVLDGKWGNGDDRKNRLTAAGHDYNAVQEAVNKRLETKQEEWYTIQRYETLSEIAERFGTTVSELVKLNGIKTPNLIYAGHKIRIK
jgi:lysozyme